MNASDAQAPRDTATIVTGFPLQRPVAVGSEAPPLVRDIASRSSLSTFRFYEGMNGEWRWYRLDSRGDVSKAGDHSFSSLLSCMLNAEAHGFLARKNYVVYARALQKEPGR
jgi:hypothetical protein